MKSKKLAAILGIVMGLSVAATGLSVSAEDAAQTTAAESDAAAQTTDGEGTDGAQGTETAEEKAEDFQITAGEKVVDVKNETAITIASAAFSADEGKESGTLLIKEESGTEHTYENVTVGDWKEASMEEEYGFLYIKYQDEAGTEQELVEKADEKTLETPVTVYAIDNANVRQEAKTDAAALYVTTVGESGQVSAAAPGWLKIQIGGVEGYAYQSFFTEDKETADAELAARQARAAQAAAAQQSASQPTTGQQYTGQASEPQGVYEVSRQRFDDCDGSGHGYYEITYSDGSVVIEEF